MQLTSGLPSCPGFIFRFLTLPVFLFVVYITPVRAQREIILNTTGYGFDRTSANGIHPGQWEYIKKFAQLKYNGKDASVTAVRFHIQWQQYEPTAGNYQGQKLAIAIQTILGLNPNLKIALHFSYLRPGYWIDTYLPNPDIAQLADGTFLKDPIADTSPSVYSESATIKFLGFVDDALIHAQPYASRILYAAMGNTGSEEFYIPMKTVNNVSSSGMYEAKSLFSWQTKFLPARYPNQNTVTWGKQTIPMSTAPQPSDGNYNSEMGRDMHRFAGWGLLKLFKGFYNTVKNRNSAIKVLHFISDFGTIQGNNRHLHSSTLPLALELSDGIYHTDGNDPSDLWRKIMGIDCIKGTQNNKIAGVEFDPVDLGKTLGVAGINGSIGTEWFARAFKHGAEYVHLAMHFEDIEIQQIAPAIAACREQFIKPSYQPPARAVPVKVNIFPTVFTAQPLFDGVWIGNAGANFAQSDLKPVSIKMTDLGYWNSIWNNDNYLPCNFSMQAATSTVTPMTGQPLTLNVTCSGPECADAGFSWSGEGANNKTGNSITITAPNLPGNYTYSAHSNRSGCGTKSANLSLNIALALPVTLIRFSAEKEGTSAMLNWATSEEENSEKFEIERSADGQKWATIGTVAASGEVSETITSYSFSDTSPLIGQNLYRLKMIDHADGTPERDRRDGIFAYSRIVTLNFDAGPAIMIYPNPAKDKIIITDSDWKSVKSIKIFNSAGNLLYKSDTPTPEINIENLPSGSYVIALIRSGGGQENVKFVKEAGR